jgi:hypothetical protein
MSYSQKPTAYAEQTSTQPKYNEGPEVYHSQPYQTQPHPQPQAQPQYNELAAPSHLPLQPTKDKKILGLRRSIFWLSAVLLLVIIAAAVGGGVGGSLAVKNAK